MAIDSVTLLVNSIIPVYNPTTNTLLLNVDSEDPPIVIVPDRDHSVTFADTTMLPILDDNKRKFLHGINTADDWYLIPASRPAIAPPEVYTNYVDLPAANGKIDLSEYLSGSTVYKNRTGSLIFYAENDKGIWNIRREIILNYLHGKEMYMALIDEPEYYYKGRFKASKPLDSDGKTQWSTVSIEYELEPFKYPFDGGGGIL